MFFKVYRTNWMQRKLIWMMRFMCLIGLLSDGWETLVVSFIYYTQNNVVTLKIVKESMLMRKTTKMTEM